MEAVDHGDGVVEVEEPGAGGELENEAERDQEDEAVLAAYGDAAAEADERSVEKDEDAAAPPAAAMAAEGRPASDPLAMFARITRLQHQLRRRPPPVPGVWLTILQAMAALPAITQQPSSDGGSAIAVPPAPALPPPVVPPLSRSDTAASGATTVLSLLNTSPTLGAAAFGGEEEEGEDDGEGGLVGQMSPSFSSLAAAAARGDRKWPVKEREGEESQQRDERKQSKRPQTELFAKAGAREVIDLTCDLD